MWRLYLLLQYAIAFLIMMPLQLLGKLLSYLQPYNLERSVGRGPYYWAVVHKRRARGEPEWQPIDYILGIPKPPHIEDAQEPVCGLSDVLPSISMCPACGNRPVLADEPFCDHCQLLDLENRISTLEGHQR